ncbi:hypothetical protein Tco_1514752 [Tanacetum coccineum]
MWLTLCGWVLLLDRKHLNVILRVLLHRQVILGDCLLGPQSFSASAQILGTWQTCLIVSLGEGKDIGQGSSVLEGQTRDERHHEGYHTLESDGNTFTRSIKG